MKIFLTARLGPFLFIDIFHILGLSSATCKRMCEPLGHLRREISGERTSWGFSDFSRGYCSVTQSCLTLCCPMDAAHQASLSLTITQSLLKLKSMSRWCHPTISFSVALSTPAFGLSQHQGLFQWVSFQGDQGLFQRVGFQGDQDLFQRVGFQGDDGFLVIVSHSCRCVSMGI